MGQFTPEMWDDIVKGVGSAFRLNDDERKDLLKDKIVPKLIAALPFLSDCDDPDRTAFAHLATYLLEIKKAQFGSTEVGACRDTDLPNVFRRIAMIGNFIGGNGSIIDRGMRLLARYMIVGYLATAPSDAANKRYNPVNDSRFGQAFCEKLAEVLRIEILSVPCADMDAILPVTPPVIDSDTWWRM